jgi:DNA-binding NarL/FixJ family response regulator
MPGMNGADATREVLRRRPAVRVIIVTAMPGSPLAEQAIAAGAYVCIPKAGDWGPAAGRHPRLTSSRRH